MDKVKSYLNLNHKYLQEAEVLVHKGDYVQASEKFWGAAAQIVKAVAAKRGRELKSHRELHRFVAEMRKEMDDPEILMWFGLAAALHQNFYENWLSPQAVIDYGEAVKQLITRLEKLA